MQTRLKLAIASIFVLGSVAGAAVVVVDAPADDVVQARDSGWNGT